MLRVNNLQCIYMNIHNTYTVIYDMKYFGLTSDPNAPNLGRIFCYPFRNKNRPFRGNKKFGPWVILIFQGHKKMRDNIISYCSREKVSKFWFRPVCGWKRKATHFWKITSFLPLSVQSEPKFGRILSKQSHFTHFISTPFEFCGWTLGPFWQYVLKSVAKNIVTLYDNI